MSTDRAATGLPLLGTKLHPPRRRRAVVARPRLRDLAAGTAHPALTLVSAPAGFGKTTLVAEWFADDRTADDRTAAAPTAAARTAWLSLDPDDDEPVRFWTYVVAALEAVHPDLGPDTSALLRAQASIDAVVATLINDLESSATEITLVLDDYHVITAPEIHASVSFLLEHLPPQARLVIATRADPPLALAALRAGGELLEVRAADLRFTAEEAAAYLNDAMDLTLTADDIGVLEARTEGWIAALQLAALSMQGRSDRAAFIAEFAGDDRFILDYLADEVLERQRPEVRAFLLETSILSRMTAPLCAAVTGSDVAAARAALEELDRSNLFLVPLDDRRTWYRYHHLFGEVLRARLLDEDAGRVALLHRRASDWYAADGDLQTAVVHALAGDDPARAAELIERAAPAMYRVRQEPVLRGWLEALPEDLFADRPVLTILLVGARMSTGDPTGVEPLLESAESWLDGDEPPVVFDRDEYARLPAMIAVYRSGLALLAGDTDATIHHAGRVLDIIGDAEPFQHGAAAALLGLAHWSRGDLDTARDRYAESITCFEDAGYLPDVFGCSLALADIQITLGRLGDAQHTFESALRHAAGTPGLRGTADMHVGLGVVAIERNDLDAATDHLRRSAELGEHTGLPQHAYRWRVATARLRQAQGDPDAALQLLREAEPLYDTDYSPRVRPVAAMTARVQVERGDLAAALRWMEAQRLRPDDELAYLREFEHVTLARILLARGSTDDVEQAVGLLRRLLAAAEAGHRSGSSIEILVQLALAHHAAGDDRAAADAAADALARAEGEGHVRVFLDGGAEMTAILQALDGRAGDRAARILGDGPSAAPQRPSTAGPDQLSERELDVLRLLRGDLSGPEIARELHVSLNTLRTHTKHIYTKLGVTNRRQAVSAAAELGI